MPLIVKGGFPILPLFLSPITLIILVFYLRPEKTSILNLRPLLVWTNGAHSWTNTFVGWCYICLALCSCCELRSASPWLDLHVHEPLGGCLPSYLRPSCDLWGSVLGGLRGALFLGVFWRDEAGWWMRRSRVFPCPVSFCPFGVVIMFEEFSFNLCFFSFWG